MNEEAKAMAEANNWELARTWAEGLGVTVLGVDLADAIQYDLLRILGSIWLSEPEQPAEAADGQ